MIIVYLKASALPPTSIRPGGWRGLGRMGRLEGGRKVGRMGGGVAGEGGAGGLIHIFQLLQGNKLGEPMHPQQAR